MNFPENGSKSIPPAPVEATSEKLLETFPSVEAMECMFADIFQGRPYRIVNQQIDEKGVVIFEVEGTDSTGDRMDLNFQRAKYDYTDPSIPSTTRYSGSIYTVLYMGDDPCGGECVANYRDGVWHRT